MTLFLSRCLRTFLINSNAICCSSRREVRCMEEPTIHEWGRWTSIRGVAPATAPIRGSGATKSTTVLGTLGTWRCVRGGIKPCGPACPHSAPCRTVSRHEVHDSCCWSFATAFARRNVLYSFFVERGETYASRRLSFLWSIVKPCSCRVSSKVYSSCVYTRLFNLT